MAHQKINYLLAFFSVIFFNASLYAAESQPIQNAASGEYRIQPGDKLDIMVWKEPDLTKEVLVSPDGRISFPLTGNIEVKGKSLTQVEQEIVNRISGYIPEPVVTVSAKELAGHKIFVIGKVNKPGEYVVNRDVDVMQALSMAGGVTPFAAVNDITVLRRNDAGQQKSIRFRYGDVEDGDNLSQNIILQAGDVIVVP
ncbi:MAG: polysaccharide biosynthesis/export family protein [Gammaproteobacteria bacterium]